MEDPRNHEEALVMALKLALTASTEEKAAQAVELANSFLPALDELTIARCKARALRELKEEAGE